jgi:hypothetical protein
MVGGLISVIATVVVACLLARYRGNRMRSYLRLPGLARITA